MPIRGCEWERKSSAGGGERGGREKRRGLRGEQKERERERGERETERLGEKRPGKREEKERETEMCERETARSGPFLDSSCNEKLITHVLCWEANEAFLPPAPEDGD